MSPSDGLPCSLPRHGLRERFLKGPIPFRWLRRAAKLPGKAMHVAVLLWHRAEMRRTAVVRPSGALLESFGISRYAAYRAYALLEQAGLVSFIRESGKNPTVTIQDVPPLPKEPRRRPRIRREQITSDLRAAVLFRDGRVCGICKIEIANLDDLHIDHIIPVARGGETVLANLQPTHSLCNIRKGGRADL